MFRTLSESEGEGEGGSGFCSVPEPLQYGALYRVKRKGFLVSLPFDDLDYLLWVTRSRFGSPSGLVVSGVFGGRPVQGGKHTTQFTAERKKTILK